MTKTVYILIFSFVFTINPIILLSQDLEKELMQVYIEKNDIKLNNFIIKWQLNLQPTDSTIVYQNDTLQNIQIIYNNCVAPYLDSLIQKDINSYGNKYRNNIIVVSEKTILGFTRHINLKKYDVYKYWDFCWHNDKMIFFDTISSFRPKLILKNKTTLYLNDIYNKAIQNVLADTLRVRYFVDKLPTFWSGYMDFEITSEPVIDFILFDKKMRNAILFYRKDYYQCALLLKKESKNWIINFDDCFLVY